MDDAEDDDQEDQRGWEVRRDGYGIARLYAEPVFPSHAEVCDVSSAVFDGTSAVILCDEVVYGDCPVKAVDAMSRIIGSSI